MRQPRAQRVWEGSKRVADIYEGRGEHAGIRADELHAEAEEATRVAREHRDRITGEYVEADDIDPDARKRR